MGFLGNSVVPYTLGSSSSQRGGSEDSVCQLRAQQPHPDPPEALFQKAGEEGVGGGESEGPGCGPWADMPPCPFSPELLIQGRLPGVNSRTGSRNQGIVYEVQD